MSDIVIDADIMRSAGTSEHPHSSQARDVLNAIWEGGHQMVQCAPIKAEHDKHQGRYASLWRTRMISKKRWVHWNYVEDHDLRQTLVSALPDEAGGKEFEIRKDAHLLEAAAATDNRIVSKDSTARNLFRLACPDLGAHRHILWGDVSDSAESVIQWIQEGCADHKHLRLCPPPD